MTVPRNRQSAQAAAADNVLSTLGGWTEGAARVIQAAPDGLGVSYRRERRRLLRIALRAVQEARRG